MENPNLKGIKFKLNTIYFIFYACLACYYAFLTVYFTQRGLSYMQIGIAYGFNSLISILAQPLWGYVADKYLTKKKTILLCAFACTALIFLFVYAQSFYFILFSIIVFMIFQSAIGPICDALSYDIIEETKGMDFGKIRLLGSVGYAVAALIMGKVIEKMGINTTFYMYALFLACTILLFFGIRYEGKKSVKKVSAHDVWAVLKDFKFILFVFAVLTSSMALGANSSYVAVLIEKTGGNVANLGLLWFIAAMSELPMFFLGHRLIKKFGALNIFLLALALYSLRMFLCGIEQGFSTVLLIQLMQGITFPFYLMGAIEYVNTIVPDKIRASGMTMLSALGFGFGGLIGSVAGGAILRGADIFMMYRFLGVICIVAFGIAFVLKLRGKVETN